MPGGGKFKLAADDAFSCMHWLVTEAPLKFSRHLATTCFCPHGPYGVHSELSIEQRGTVPLFPYLYGWHGWQRKCRTWFNSAEHLGNGESPMPTRWYARCSLVQQGDGRSWWSTLLVRLRHQSSRGCWKEGRANLLSLGGLHIWRPRDFFNFRPLPLSVHKIYTVCPQIWGLFLPPPSVRTSYMEGRPLGQRTVCAAAAEEKMVINQFTTDSLAQFPFPLPSSGERRRPLWF